VTHRDTQVGRHEMTEKLGEEFVTQYNAAEKIAHRSEGAHAYLITASKTIVKSLHEHVRKDLEEGEGDEKPFPSGGSDAEILSYVLKQITRAGEAMNNLALKAQSEAISANGQVAAFNNVIKTIALHRKASNAAVMLTDMQNAEEEKLLSGDPDVGETPAEQSFIEMVRAAADPMEVEGSNGGKHTKRERRLVTREMQRREMCTPKKVTKKKATKKKVAKKKRQPANGASAR
jgi:hypothetical protein